VAVNHTMLVRFQPGEPLQADALGHHFAGVLSACKNVCGVNHIIRAAQLGVAILGERASKQNKKRPACWCRWLESKDLVLCRYPPA
jgi:hypothetical protein